MGTQELKKYVVRENYFVLGRPEQPMQNKNLLRRHDKPNEPTKEGVEGPRHVYSLSPHSP
jgi:hypothetical protein